MKQRLGKRLLKVADFSSKYLADAESFVDMCCDHGHLGLFISESFSKRMYFVDPVKTIIEKLQDKISESEKSRITCLDIKGQNFTYTENLPVVAICGVGGDLIWEIVQSITHKNPHSSPIFVLAPQNRPVELREELNGQGFGVDQEGLVKDNGKYYEIMCVAEVFEKPLSLIGESAFDLNDNSHLSYLKKKRDHYDFKSRKFPEFKKVVQMYDALLGKS